MGMKGYFFTLDAILALFILFTGLMLVSNIYITTQPRTQINAYSQDIISLLAQTKVTELNNSYLEILIQNKNITEFDNTVLEQIGIFWVTNKTGLAQSLAKNISHDMIPGRFGFSFVVGGDVVYSEPKPEGKELASYKSMITGIEKSRPVKGTAARIFLSSAAEGLRSRYVYFGGFVGQGNLSRFIDGIPSDADILGIQMELDAGSNFTLYINGFACANLNISQTNMTADFWDVSFCNASIAPGQRNNFSIVFGTENMSRQFAGGGYIRVDYTTKDVYIKDVNSSTYYFPGIWGLVNLYSGFSVPGSLDNMTVYLHYRANHTNASNNTFYLTIGNKTVYRDNYSDTTMQVTLNNTYLSGILDYAALSNQTVPLRVGFENLSYEYIYTDKGNGDAVAITDVSGSMSWEFTSTSNGAERFCMDNDLSESSSMRLSVAKCILKTFAHDLLYNITGNRVGLVAYEQGIRDTTALGTNLTFIEDEVNAYHAQGSTCTSCGVYSAAGILGSSDYVNPLNKEWRYTNDYQSSDPAQWTLGSFDDSAWSTGYLDFGFGTDADTYTGNVLQADLWEYSDDAPMPADFTSGILSEGNTFGFVSVQSITYPLSNSYFDGPSFASWSATGAVHLSGDATVLFSDNFNDGNLNGWALHTGLHGAPSAHANAQSPFSSGAYGARLTGGYDGDNSPGSGTSGGWDPWMTVAFDTSGYKSLRVEYSRAGEADSGDVHDAGEDFRFAWSTDSWSSRTQEENIEIRNGNLEHGTTIFELRGQPIWGNRSFLLSQAASHPDFEMRFSSDGSWSGEHTYVDDVALYGILGNSFGLRDYWLMNSSLGQIGYISQSFESPSATPNSATLGLVHSVNHSLFAGSATFFCNLTHPGGESVVWDELWTAASPPPEGPTAEEIDITGLITSDGFIYTLECGANASGAPLVVAFDNITVEINWTNNGDDGWDWENGTFGYSGNMMHFVEGRGALEMAADASSSDASGAYGIQIMVTQDMIDMMNSLGGSAFLSFDYRWDAGDDGSSDIYESNDEVWIKGYWQKPSLARHWLGTETSNVDGDTGPEIWSATDPDTETSGHYDEDISAHIDEGPGYYYLALGGRLMRSSSAEIGAFSFDNIQLAFTNSSGNTFYRNPFFIRSLSDLHDPIEFLVSSDGGADIYLNSVQIDSYGAPVTNRAVPVLASDFVQGDNVLAVKLKNADGTGRLSVSLLANITGRQKAMVIMSDGEANDCLAQHGAGTDTGCNDCGRACCPGSDGVIDEPCPSIAELAGCSDRYAKEQLVNLSCYYHRERNISIYSVAFGDVAACGKTALNLSALCDDSYTETEPHYFESDSPEGLAGIYGQIANELRLAFSVRQSQIIEMVGEYEPSVLYPDSFISLKYRPIVQPVEHGDMPIFIETPDFGNCSSSVLIPSQVRPLEAFVTSYSAEHWTDRLTVTNSMGTLVAYNLSSYNSEYSNLGDPFPIAIPGSYLLPGETNIITLSTGDSPTNFTNCSSNTTMHYTALINVINHTMPYSKVLPNATGCSWTVELDIGENISILVPDEYSGPKSCVYTNASHDSTGHDTQDSFDAAMYSFLTFLDYNNDGRIFLRFDNDDLGVSSRVVRDVPYLWGPTIAEVRVWQ